MWPFFRLEIQLQWGCPIRVLSLACWEPFIERDLQHNRIQTSQSKLQIETRRVLNSLRASDLFCANKPVFTQRGHFRKCVVWPNSQWRLVNGRTRSEQKLLVSLCKYIIYCIHHSPATITAIRKDRYPENASRILHTHTSWIKILDAPI